MTETRTKPPLATPWKELRRYGYRRAFLSRWTGLALAAALVLPFIVPWGQYGSLGLLAGLHGGLLGFGLTVFGFTILGGKDDFFEPVMKSQGAAGLDALRDMVLLLWWPVLLHGAALALCMVRILGKSFWGNHHCAATAWRMVYVFAAVWAMTQTYHSVRYLFILAITRLKWRYKELHGNSPGASGDPTEPEEKENR